MTGRGALGVTSAHRAVAAVLERLRGDTRHLHLIEIESGGASLGEHLQENTITRLDLDATAAALLEGGESEPPGGRR
jgi:hypothetical protein